MEIGYACINTELQKQGIKNRTLITRTLEKKGWEYYNQLVLDNVRDLKKILEWNEAHQIRAFRVSADLFPQKHLVKSIRNLDRFPEIEAALREVGSYAVAHGHRISFHVDAYCIPASQKQQVVENSFHEINYLSEILDVMGVECSQKNKVNFHLGTFKPSKKEAVARFLNNVHLLSPSAWKRATIENDDNPNAFSVRDLYEMVYPHVKLPIVLDYFHHSLNTGGDTLEDVIEMVKETWGDIRPMTHYSSSAKLNENADKKNIAHADYIYEKIPSDFGDVMIEAKAKEKAVLRYRNTLHS